MICIDGTLLVRKIKQSRNGPFCVADLVTDVGEFKVKDPLLDQFAEGEYRGKFWLSEIYLSQYVAFGRGVTELRARLHDLQVDSERALPKGAVPQAAELDPADEPPQVRLRQGSKETPGKPRLKIPAKGESGRDSDKKRQTLDADRQLFGDDIFELVQARQPLKLDATIERITHRKQAERLGEIGYIFNAKQQSWSPPA